MNIAPLRPQKPKPVALLVPGWKSLTSITDDGEVVTRGPQRCWDRLADLSGHTCFTPGSLKGMLATTGARSWSADLWKGRPTTMHLDGTTTKVRSLRRTLSGTPPEVFASLSEVVGWLADQGVRMSSLSTTAWSLWRSTLPAPLTLGFSAKVGRAAMYGGRQGADRPAEFTDQVSLDIASAYPHAMASRPYAGLLREVSRSTTLDPEVAGIVRATVVMPDDLPFPALPVRVTPEMIQWRWGTLQGTWTWAELVAATNLGASVAVERCWAPQTTVDPFGPWWEVVRAGREAVSPAAAPLVKAIANTTFGCFAMDGSDRASVQWLDDIGERPERIRQPAKFVPQANTVHLAAETTSRVRVRMLTEGLYGDAEAPCHVDTDGIIVSGRSAARRHLGDGPGQWRVKNVMDLVEVKAPQVYRWRGIDQCWHYVVSGVPPERAPHLFDRLPTFGIAVTGIDAVIPSGHALDAEQVKRWEMALAQVERETFGPRVMT